MTTPEQSPAALAGLKVVEMGSLIAGPFCSRIFAEFGAKVIKIEPIDGGDPLRQWRKMHGNTSLWWYLQARNKRSLSLNLKSEAGLTIVKQLLGDADVLIENFRPGVLGKLGLGYEELSALNPRLVMVSLSGFGQSGPMKNQPGFGAIGESMGGLRFITGYPDRPPVKNGISIGDSIAALWGALGAMMALRHRDHVSGKGQQVDVALYEAVFAMLESTVPEYAMFNFIRQRTGNVMPGITPSNTHTFKDGNSLVIGANGDAIFGRLMRLIGRDDMAERADFASNSGRDKCADAIYQAIDDWAAQYDSEEALVLLAEADVPTTKVFSVADMFQHPQFLARQMIESHQLADGQEISLPGIVPKLSASPGATKSLGPALGEHNQEILRELGYNETEIGELRHQGVIG